MTNPKKPQQRKIMQISEQEKGDKMSPQAGRFAGMKTSEIIATLRKENGYTLAEISDISATAPGTVKAWSQGRRSPTVSTRFRLIEIFTDPNVRPSKKNHREMLDTHHLSWDSNLGWRYRFTLDLDPKKVGKRIKIRLQTHDQKEAIRRRHVINNLLNILGLNLANKKQKRSGPRNA